MLPDIGQLGNRRGHFISRFFFFDLVASTTNWFTSHSVRGVEFRRGRVKGKRPKNETFRDLEALKLKECIRVKC